MRVSSNYFLIWPIFDGFYCDEESEWYCSYRMILGDIEASNNSLMSVREPVKLSRRNNAPIESWVVIMLYKLQSHFMNSCWLGVIKYIYKYIYDSINITVHVNIDI